MTDFIELNKRMDLIETKSRNSFSEVRKNNELISSKIDRLTTLLGNDYFKLIEDSISKLDKKIDLNDKSFKKFKKEMARETLRKEILKELALDVGKKIKAGLDEVESRFKKLDREVKANEINNTRIVERFKDDILEQNKLIDKYGAKLEEYSLHLEKSYLKDKKSLSSLTSRHISSLKGEIKKLRAQIGDSTKIESDKKGGFFGRIIRR
jgi:hypothetical protein